MNERINFNAATRVAAADDGANYDPVAIFLRWATAVLVLIQFLLAFTCDWFAHDTTETMQSVHISLGLLLTAVVLARVTWRLISSHQVSSLEVGLVRFFSKRVHYLLYLLLVA